MEEVEEINTSQKTVKMRLNEKLIMMSCMLKIKSEKKTEPRLTLLFHSFLASNFNDSIKWRQNISRNRKKDNAIKTSSQNNRIKLYMK